MGGIFPDEPPNAVRLTAELIASAKQFDDDQEARAREFQRDYERVMGKGAVQVPKLPPRTPVTWAWLRRRMLPLWYSSCLPGRIIPHLVFGGFPSNTDSSEVGLARLARWRGYIPIERRIVLTNTRFGEILAAGDKTPKRKMVHL